MNQPLEEMTDEYLMLECQKDNLEAFNILFRRYEKRILNFSFRFVGDRLSAEEITLDTFMRAYRARKRYQPTARFSTWIYSIAKNLCRDFSKAKSKDEMIFEDVYELDLADESQSNPDEMSLKGELKLKVMEAINSLPQKQKEAIIMSYYEGFSYPEIAAILRCSPASVKMAAHRAYLKLRELLSEYVMEGFKSSCSPNF